MKTKFYKTQRHNIYQEALKRIECGETYICHAIEKAGGGDVNNLEEFGYELDVLAPDNYRKGLAHLHTCVTADCYNNGKHLSNTHNTKAVRETILMFCIEMTR